MILNVYNFFHNSCVSASLSFYVFLGLLEKFLTILLGSECLQLIATNIVGGVVTYRYVMCKEKRKETKAKKEKCANALLNVQMKLNLQMAYIISIRETFNKILSFEIDGQTLEQYFSAVPKVSGKFNILCEIIKKPDFDINKLVPLTNHVVVAPVSSYLIDLPSEVFDMATIPRINKKIVTGTLALYLQDLASCNRKYLDIITSISRFNEIREQMINKNMLGSVTVREEDKMPQDIMSVLSLIAGICTTALESTDMVAKYLDRADKAFSQAEGYIDLLGIATPIRAQRDENGKIIFDKV